ncbi:MAG: HAMP domain-containing protein [Deltaproteobacteria bacterium]|nr:HAMP domain-containing protein [Deltaproteobacteria bacterium]
MADRLTLRLRLQTKIILLMVLIVVTVAVAFTYLDLKLSERALDEDLRGRALIFAEELAAAVGDRTELGNATLLQGIISRVMEARRNIRQIDILVAERNRLRLVASSRPERPVSLTRKAQRAIIRGQAASELVQGPAGRGWEVVAPIRLGGQVVGATAVVFSLRRFDETAAHARWQSLMLSATTVLVILVLMTLFLRRTVERPLRRLMEGMRRVQAGDLTTQIEPQTTDELGELACHFNRMIASVREGHEQNRQLVERIQRLNEELQEKVEAATSELAARNAELHRTNQALFSIQRRVSQADRLALAGRLAATFAHEIGTPLHSLAGHLELLEKELSDGAVPHQRDRLGIVRSQIDRIVEAVNGLLSLSRPQEARLEALDLNRVVRETGALIQPALAARQISLQMELSSVPLPVYGDVHRLEQVFLNLMTNAVDAMQEGGRLIARTSGVDATVVATVEDTGVGIAPEDLRRIFNPFFTTKEIGRGTGLGLFVCEQILKEHQGKISVESEPGKGTRVIVSLPRREGASAG